MSANIQTMMYAGETPWHGLGKKLDGEVTSAEAIVHAGLNWTVSKQPVLFQTPSGYKTVRDQFVIQRDDNQTALGVVGRVYTPLQNVDAFRFFDAVVGEKAAMYHTAGALGDGQRVWILAKLPGYIRIKGGDDVTEKFLLLSNSHDGSGSVKVLFTPIRVVCQNTLNIALGEADKSHVAKLKHSSQIGLQVRNVREQIGLINEQFGLFEDAAQRLASVQVGTKGFEEFLKRSGLMPKNQDDKATTRAANIIGEVTALFESKQKGADLLGVKGTAWGAFNAVAEYADYHRTTRTSEGETAEANRAESLLFGSGAHLKQKAWDAALSLA